jgi:hypothetical protein
MFQSRNVLWEPHCEVTRESDTDEKIEYKKITQSPFSFVLMQNRMKKTMGNKEDMELII